MIEERKPTKPYKQTTAVDDMLARIAGLVHDRELLEQRNANEAELRETSIEIARLQWRLASIVQGTQRRQRAAPHERHHPSAAAAC